MSTILIFETSIAAEAGVIIDAEVSAMDKSILETIRDTVAGLEQAGVTVDDEELKQLCQMGLDQLERGEGFTAESKAALDELFDEIKK